MAFLTPEDLDPFADIPLDTAQEMIADATAYAVMVAPCLANEDELSPQQTAAVKAVLRGAILRWHDAGSGVVSQETLGAFNQSFDTTSRRSGMFWPSEEQQLKGLCAAKSGGAFEIDTWGTRGQPRHAETCSTVFGADFCDCGADLTGGGPLWG